MSFKIDRGLFKLDFTDHHAVLCVPVDADIKDIRKRYLKIARRLHPDSCASASEADKQRASELLSKLVNPAYEKLSNERNRAEYIVLLSQMSKRLVQESATVELKTELARQLAQAPNVDHLYKTSLAKLAETQYDSLEQVLQVIGQISELNLVYLMRNSGKAFAQPAPVAPPKTQSGVPTPTTGKTPAAPPPPAPQEETVVGQYLRRAQTLMTKNQFAQARVELQDALKLEPNNSRCHTMMGVVYWKQNQLKMAKIHFDRALALNPKDETATKGKRAVEQVLGQQKPGSQTTTPPQSAGNKQPEKKGGGLFGGLFGGKKK